MTDELDALEELELAASWLGFQSEALILGLRNGDDALKLWRYWTNADGLPEFCDRPKDEAERAVFVAHLKKAIGYDPLSAQ
jgi:hypothetical protein